MPYPYSHDFKNPDFSRIFQWRIDILQKIRRDAGLLAAMRMHYRENPIDFIEDWFVTFDPRNVTKKLPALMPLVLFPRQKEFLHWVLDMMRRAEFGLSDKSRDMGLSWMLVSLATALGLTSDGVTVGFGSRKEALVDKAGDPDCLFYKIRMLLANIPVEFRGGWVETQRQCSTHMLITIPETGAVFRGEAGDNIGRGGRTTVYFVDEAAFLERPHLIDAALSQNTNCRIDISSVNGYDNPFAEKRHSWEPHRIFTFHWHDDPRKDDAWYEKQKRNLNPLIVAQEIDLSYSASKSGVVIPGDWVLSAIGAFRKLGITPNGRKRSALDVADEGIDLNAWIGAHGCEVTHADAWSGQGKTIFWTTEQAFLRCDLYGYDNVKYDSDGLGVGVRGDAAQINAREDRKTSQREFIPYRGSGAVVNPTQLVVKGDDKGIGARKNEDFFRNLKAQAWWSLRERFERTHRAVTEGAEFDPDSLISISEAIPSNVRTKIIAELSQATYDINPQTGKMIIDKTPEGQRSPNYADGVVILFAPEERKSSLFAKR
jgi:phage terminase large subunit